jgi:hypothetical protein
VINNLIAYILSASILVLPGLSYASIGGFKPGTITRPGTIGGGTPSIPMPSAKLIKFTAELATYPSTPGPEGAIQEFCWTSREVIGFRRCGLIAAKLENSSPIAVVLFPSFNGAGQEFDASLTAYTPAVRFETVSPNDYNSLVFRYSQGQITANVEDLLEDVDDANEAVRNASYDVGVTVGGCFFQTTACGFHAYAGAQTGGIAWLGISYTCGAALFACVQISEKQRIYERAKAKLAAKQAKLKAAQQAARGTSSEENINNGIGGAGEPVPITPEGSKIPGGTVTIIDNPPRPEPLPDGGSGVCPTISGRPICDNPF